MPSMPNLELDIAIPTSFSNAAKRVRTSIPDLNLRLVVGVIAAVIGGPFLLFAGYLLYLVNSATGMSALPSGR
jgi:hypothetical protein